MKLRGVILCGVAGMAVGHGAAIAQGVPAAAADAGASSQGLGQAEIVVTANKRTELAQQVPATITALTGGTLDRQNIVQFKDYVAQVPGLSTTGGGSAGFGQVILRGISTGAQQTSPTVGFYIDETPVTANGPLAIGAAIASDPDLGDVSRIEVLKGPQSTLYGASSLGGLIKVVTNQPEFDKVSGEARVGIVGTQGGDIGYSGRAVVNLPLGDTLAIRAVGYYRRDGGFVDDVVSGRKNVDDSKSYGGRVTLRFKPSDRFEIKATGLLQNIDNADLSSVSVDASGKPVAGRYGDIAYTPQPSTVRYRLGNLVASYDLGFASLTSSSSYSYQHAVSHIDYSTSYGGALGLFPTYLTPSTFVYGTKKFTQEVRLASPKSEHFEWMIGGFYTHEKNEYDTLLFVADPDGTVLPGAAGNFYTTHISSKYREYAVFGNATYYLTPHFDVSAGIRYAHNSQDYIAPRSGILCGARCASAPDGIDIRQGRSSESAKTYQFTARWRPADRVNIYARAASAYRPGGPVISSPAAGIPTSFQSDRLWNYELGAKTQFAGGRVLLDVSGYHIDWTNIQLNALIGGFTITGNGGKATSDGAEMTLTVMPTRGLTFSTNFSYNKTKLKSVPASVTAVTGAYPGDALPYTPKVTVAFNGDYSFPLADDVKGLLGGTLTFQDSKISSFSGDDTNRPIKIPSYAQLNLRAGIDVSRYEVLLTVNNVTNSFGIVSASNSALLSTQTLPFQATVIRPRSYGVTVSAKF